MASEKLRVVVIGAGAAGLCAVRHIMAQPDVFAAPVVFESSDRVGGTWVYNEESGTSKDGLPIHSSMYRDLRTNLPKEVMAFPDHPFHPQLPSFLHHSEVLAYLEGYAEHFGVKKHIQFSRLVERVTPVPSPGGEAGGTGKWDVTTRCMGDLGTMTTQRFDAVMVCNGHYVDPFIPPLPGIDHFQGTSHEQTDHGVCKRTRTDVHSVDSDSSGSSSGGGSSRRTIFSKDQLAFLRTAFQLNPYPDFTRRLHISQVTGVPESRVQVWFQNRRARNLPKPPKPSLDQHQYQDIHHPTHLRGEQPQKVLPCIQQPGAHLPVRVGGPPSNHQATFSQAPWAWQHGPGDPQPVIVQDPPSNQQTLYLQPPWHHGPEQPLPMSVNAPSSNQQARYTQAPWCHVQRESPSLLAWNQHTDFLCALDFLEVGLHAYQWPPHSTIDSPPCDTDLREAWPNAFEWPPLITFGSPPPSLWSSVNQLR